jgi:hypothetical protein
MTIPAPILERFINAIETLNQSIAELIDLNQPDEHLSNADVCEMLKIGPDALRRKIVSKLFIDGYHYTGKRGDRLWSKRRMTRYLETRHDLTLQQNDLKQWHRSLKKSEKL